MEGIGEHGDGLILGRAHGETVRRVRALIRDGEFQPGERIGTERALSAHLGVSRSDLRAALACLESLHEISRKIGRGGGITVADRRLERNINTVESLPIIARRQGFVLESTVLSASITPASPGDVRLLGLRGDHPVVYGVTRLRSIEGEPLSLEISRLPADLFPLFLTRDLTESFYTIFDRDYGIRPVGVEETLENVLSDPRESELLNVPEETALMRIRRVACDALGRPFERATDVYIASRMRFTMHHTGYVRLSATARS